MATNPAELIDPEILKEIKLIAKENNMSLNDLLRWIIFGYHSHKKENDEKPLYDLLEKSH